MIKLFKKYVFTFISLLKGCKYQVKPNVYGFSLFTKGTTLGKNTNFNGFRVYGGGTISIGDNFHSGKNCKVITQVHNYHGSSLPYDDTYLTKDIVIGDNVWFGMDVTILSSCHIGEGAIIQAGSVIVNDIPPLAIAGGNPAKVFKYRDKEHYYSLKSLSNNG
ncbi:acyltransferase [Vibrio sp. TRT 21S02]|uniref:acyltransferase n=1 Tax=Vibrio sp. TRT 21S02 TaxID=3418507 RepID=UPI003CF3534D